MDRREVAETLMLLALTWALMLVGLRLARALASALAWALVAVQ